MKKQIIILTTSLLLLGNINAQEVLPIIEDEKKGFDLSLSYYGEMMLHPGLKAGIGYPILSKTFRKTKTRKRSGVTVFKTRKHQLIGQAKLGFYHHARNHTNTFINLEVGYRLNLDRQINEKPIRGMQFEVLAGFGPMYYFLAGDTYVFDGEQATVKKNAGNLAWMSTLSVSVGGRIPNKKDRPIYWYFKPSAFWETPFNLGYLVHPVLEIGVRLKI